MTIFDTRLGERPTLHIQSARAGPRAPDQPPAMAATLGSRPVGMCPAEIDLAGVLTGAAVMMLAPAIPPAHTQAETLAAIDAALRQNSARVTINGLFDLDEYESR